MLKQLVHDHIGLLHLVFSLLAMVSGIWVLVTTKGTKDHRRIGYFYVVCMLGLNLSAFFIYHLFGRFGVFHWLAVVSLVTLALGVVPVIRKTQPNYRVTHFIFMYWSVIGLYCAAVSEIFTRLPKIVLDANGRPVTVFYSFVGIGTLLVMVVGTAFYIRYKPVWKQQFSDKP